MSKFKSIRDAVNEASSYIEGRMKGEIKSLRTGYPKLDKYMIDGIEWNSTITIGGRPSVGKSAVSDCIIDGCFENNLDENGKPTFDLLDFNWELSSRVTLLRRLSSKMKVSYRHIISAESNMVTSEEFEKMKGYLEHYANLPITFCEEPLSTREFGDTVERYVLAHPGRKVLVRVDHTLLTKMTASDGSQVQMLLNLLAEANRLKKKYPLIFLFLTQINREFEDRQEDNTDKAYPRQGDVYGGDAAAMFSETIILLNKPSKFGINYYGKRPGGVVVGENDIFFHMVKNRNSAPDIILQYKEDFKNMTIKEY